MWELIALSPTYAFSIIATEHCLLNMLVHEWSEELLHLLKQYF